jgi:hypothetical protein
MASNIKTRTMRSANAVDAQPDRIESADGQRWATGRNVKGETGTPGVFQTVRIYTLKCRGANGRAVTMKTHASETDARAFCFIAEKPARPAGVFIEHGEMADILRALHGARGAMVTGECNARHKPTQALLEEHRRQLEMRIRLLESSVAKALAGG